MFRKKPFASTACRPNADKFSNRTVSPPLHGDAIASPRKRASISGARNFEIAEPLPALQKYSIRNHRPFRNTIGPAVP